MDPNNGRIYESLDAAQLAGVKDAVEITGKLEAIQRISDAVQAAHKAKRKAQKKARRLNR